MLVTPEINRRRIRFVALGEHLCEVRAKQYWKLENLKLIDEFLEKRFADSQKLNVIELIAELQRLPQEASFRRDVFPVS
jgi:hypothetical protein